MRMMHRSPVWLNSDNFCIDNFWWYQRCWSSFAADADGCDGDGDADGCDADADGDADGHGCDAGADGCDGG